MGGSSSAGVDSQAAFDVEERHDPAGVGTPGGTPYTVYFPSENGYVAADLTHPASLPCVGDRLDYVDEEGRSHAYRVKDVVHVLQAVPALRPRVGFARSEAREPEPADEGAPDAADDGNRRPIPEAPAVRSGLPKVFLELADEG